MKAPVADAEGRSIEYRPLKSLKTNPDNPKAHSDATITESINRFGYIEPIVVDGRTGLIISGHGRTDALRRAEAAGGDPPEGVLVGERGEWLAPVVAGWESTDDVEASAALIALNRTTELGGWVDETLLAALDALADQEGGLVGVGYEPDDIAALRLALEGGDGEHPEYTRRADIPHYEPTSDVPPAVADLLDTEKTRELVARIRETDLPNDVRAFLLAAAARHTRFHYGRIAEFYAHSGPDVQGLMEDSALVIIDAADAIRNGYVRLSNRLGEILSADLAENDEYDDDDAG